LLHGVTPFLAVKFSAALLPNREAELCRLEDREKVPASLSAPRTARQKLGVLVSTDKKIAAKAACPPFHRASKPGAAFGRDFFHFNAPFTARQVEILLKTIHSHFAALNIVPASFPIHFLFNRNLTRV